MNTSTGKTAWQRNREIHYGTKIAIGKRPTGTGSVFKIKGRDAVVYPSAAATIAYDVSTGETIWTVYHGGMNASARPLKTRAGNLIITNGMGQMVSVAPNGQGDITKSNVQWKNRRGISKKPTPLICGEPDLPGE